MPCAPVWSWPRACASRGIENLLRALDVGGDETVLDGVDHDEIYLDGQNRAELIEEAEVSIHEIVRMHGAELDEQVQVALSGPKVVAKGGAEDVEACHPETRACLSDSRALVSGYIDHVAPPGTMVPRATAALPAKTQVGDGCGRRTNVWRVSRRAPPRASLPEPTFRGALSAGREGWAGAHQWVTRNSSTVMRTSAAILRSSVGEMSRPE